MQFQNQRFGNVVIPRVIRELIAEYAPRAVTVLVPEWWDMYEEDWTMWGSMTRSCPEVFFFGLCLFCILVLQQCGLYEDHWTRGPSGWGWLTYDGAKAGEPGRFHTTVTCTWECMTSYEADITASEE